MKRFFAPAAIWRLAMFTVLGATYWTVVARSLEQQLCLAAFVAAFVLGVAADLLILPRIILWQIAPSFILATVLIWALKLPTSIYTDLPDSFEDALLISVLLLVLLAILLVAIGVPAIMGTAISWGMRTIIVERAGKLANPIGDIVFKVPRWTWPGLSRIAGAVLVLGTVTIPTLIPFHGTEGPRVASQDGQYVAWIREFNCGATCPFHPWVVVQDRGDSQLVRFWVPEEVIVFETERTAPSEIWLTWKSERELTIRFVNYDPDAITVQKQEWHDMTITYEPVSP